MITNDNKMIKNDKEKVAKKSNFSLPFFGDN